MTNDKKPIPNEVRTFFAEIGRKNGKKLFEERGSEYFSKIAGMRKLHGRQRKESIVGSVQQLVNQYGISRQRIYQIIKRDGHKTPRSAYKDIDNWREAIIKNYFENK